MYGFGDSKDRWFEAQQNQNDRYFDWLDENEREDEPGVWDDFIEYESDGFIEPDNYDDPADYRDY